VSREPRSHRVSVSLTEHEKDALERIAERSDLSLSRIVQEALREFMNNHGDETVDLVRASGRKSSS